MLLGGHRLPRCIGGCTHGPSASTKGVTVNIDRLKEFLFLSETLSFNATAKNFYLSQSVLSKRIAAMEEELGAKLFVRDSHHVRLTEQGAAFQHHARIILADYERALSHVRAISEDYDAFARVGYLRNASRPLLPGLVSALRKRHPRVSVSLTCMEYGELHHALATRRIDAALTLDLDPALRDRYRVLPLYRDRFYAVVGQGHPLASGRENGDALHLSDLVGQRLLLPDPEDYPGMSAFLDGALGAVGLEQPREFYSDVDTLFLRLASEDLVGFSSGHNLPSFGDQARFLPVEDAPTSYSVCALIDPSLAAEAADALTEALTSLRAPTFSL